MAKQSNNNGTGSRRGRKPSTGSIPVKVQNDNTGASANQSQKNDSKKMIRCLTLKSFELNNEKFIALHRYSFDEQTVNSLLESKSIQICNNQENA